MRKTLVTVFAAAVGLLAVSGPLLAHHRPRSSTSERGSRSRER